MFFVLVERCGVVDLGMLLHDIAETSLGQFQIFAMPGRSQICLRAGLANTGLFREMCFKLWEKLLSGFCPLRGGGTP